MNQYVFLTMTYDDKEKIYALRKDVEEVCKSCSVCDGEDIEDGCGCLTAFVLICNSDRPIFYESDLRKIKK